MKVANEFKSKVMNYAIASKDDYSRDFDSFGLSSEGDDPIVSIKSDDGSKYAMKEKFRYQLLQIKFFLHFLLLSKKMPATLFGYLCSLHMILILVCFMPETWYKVVTTAVNV